VCVGNVELRGAESKSIELKSVTC